MILRNIVRKNRYFDSVVLMELSAEIGKQEGIDEISIMMGTESNKDILRQTGLLDSEGEGAEPNDLLICVRGESPESVSRAEEMVEEGIQRDSRATGKGAEFRPASIHSAASRNPETNLVLISVPGRHAFHEARIALELGKHVMIFSDNVPLEQEIRLKEEARSRNLLVMGPDCGTSILNGTALGFANVVERGPVGIVGASGTGIQEVSVLLSNMGHGISQAIGLGGRDLSEEVGGLSMLTAIDSLEVDEKTALIILISKPPAPVVESRILDRAARLSKKVVINFLNGSPEEAAKRNLPFAQTLEGAARLVASLLEEERPRQRGIFSQPFEAVPGEARVEWEKLNPSQKYVRGLYSGGTLCDEAMILLADELGPVHSNIPLRPDLALTDTGRSREHTVIDLGDDEFTRGVPHPMIDFTVRNERLIREGKDPEVAVVLLDIVLGHGSHPDPAGAIVPAIREARDCLPGRYLSVIAHVCGTDLDPQNYGRQCETLRGAGVTVLSSNAQAARFAALVARRGNRNREVTR